MWDRFAEFDAENPDLNVLATAIAAELGERGYEVGAPFRVQDCTILSLVADRTEFSVGLWDKAGVKSGRYSLQLSWLPRAYENAEETRRRYFNEILNLVVEALKTCAGVSRVDLAP